MSQFYTIQAVNTTQFDPDSYGNVFYSIKFAEMADNVLWKTKARPQSGTKVYGRVEKSRSGKAWIFKREQVPEDVLPKGASPQQSQFSNPPDSINGVLERLEAVVNRLNDIVEEMTGQEQKLGTEPHTQPDDFDDRDFNLDDIPF